MTNPSPSRPFLVGGSSSRPRSRVSYSPTLKPHRLWGGVRIVNRPSFRNVARLDIGIVPMVVRMKRNGLPIDREWFTDLTARLRSEKEEIHCRIEETAGFAVQNVGSDTQIAALLFDKLHLPTEGIRKTEAGDRFSTADEYLERLVPHEVEGRLVGHPVVPLIQDWRERNKLETSYTLPFLRLADRDDCIRSHEIKLTSVETGRLSVSNPNLMALPTRTDLGKDIRRGVRARPGRRIVRVDESQIEMRMAAHYSSDPAMMRVFHNGLDIHSETASKMFGLPVDRLDKNLHRYPAKRVGFGTLFGITGEGLLDQMLAARAIGWTVEKCQALIDRWFEIYSGIRSWMGEQYARARRFGLVWDLFGRPRFIPEVKSAHKHVVEAGLRQSGNSPIQAGAQGTIKLAMAEIDYLAGLWREAGWYCEPLIQVHDEVIFEVEDEIAEEFAEQCKLIIANCCMLRVPIEAEGKVGERWEELVAA